MNNKEALKSKEEIDNEFSAFGKKGKSNKNEERSLDIFPNEELIPDGPEISLSDDTIRLLDDDINKYKTVKEIILEEELRKKEDIIKRYKKEKSVNEITGADDESILNPGIQKITEDDPDEKIMRDIKKKKMQKSIRNRNEMFL